MENVVLDFITEVDFEECAKLVSDCFTCDEPFTQALFPESLLDLNQGHVGLGFYINSLREELLSLGLSMKAVTSDTSQIVGAFFVCKGKIPNFQDLFKTNQDMGEIYSELYCHYIPEENTSQYLFSGVLPSYRRRGILTAARMRIMEESKKRGFEYIYSETSSYASKKSLEGLGAIEKAGVRYSTWNNSKGINPFSVVRLPHEGIYIMEIKL